MSRPLPPRRGGFGPSRHARRGHEDSHVARADGAHLCGLGPLVPRYPPAVPLSSSSSRPARAGGTQSSTPRLLWASVSLWPR